MKASANLEKQFLGHVIDENGISAGTGTPARVFIRVSYY